MDQNLTRRAREWTADELRRLRLHGWLSLDSVMLETGTLDHALLGPGGFFAIDNKYRADWSSDKRDLGTIVRRSHRSADDLGVRMGLGARRARPLVVVWGPDVHSLFPEVFDHDGVTFLRGDQLRHHVRSTTCDVGDDEVRSAVAHLDYYARWRSRTATAS